MKKSRLILAAAALALTVIFAECSKSGDGSSDDQTSDNQANGITINGVVWAECNVDATGTFAAKPEDYGMFYQWNRSKAWSATGATVTGWDSTAPSGDTWDTANDPCPSGWRVPTKDEQATLFNPAYVTNVWTAVNGVNGQRFTDNVSGASIFLPAAGERDLTGALTDAGIIGRYVSSSPRMSTEDVYILYFQINSAGTSEYFLRNCGYSVRCVRQ